MSIYVFIKDSNVLYVDIRFPLCKRVTYDFLMRNVPLSYESICPTLRSMVSLCRHEGSKRCLIIRQKFYIVQHDILAYGFILRNIYYLLFI